MLISTRSRYALRALTELVNTQTEGPVSLGSLAERQEIPLRYLEQIFGRLRAAGLVKGRRGPGGGYVLSRPAPSIQLIDVVAALEASFLPGSCIEDGWECGTENQGSGGTCTREKDCLTKALWVRLRDTYRDLLSSNTLEDLACGRIRDQRPSKKG
jgi:Rrf2 family iron-sulfur cluster assembly transcriptional regulator